MFRTAIAAGALGALTWSAAAQTSVRWPADHFTMTDGLPITVTEFLNGHWVTQTLLDPIAVHSISADGQWFAGSAFATQDRRPFRYTPDGAGNWTLDIVLGIQGFNGDVEALGISATGAMGGYGLRDEEPGVERPRAMNADGEPGHTLLHPDGFDGEGCATSIVRYVPFEDPGAPERDEACSDLDRAIGYLIDYSGERRAAVWGPYDTDDDAPFATFLPVLDPAAPSAAYAQSQWTQIVGEQDGRACLWTYTPDALGACRQGTWDGVLLETSDGATSRAVDVSNTDTNTGVAQEAIIVGEETSADGVRHAVRWMYDGAARGWTATSLAPADAVWSSARAVDHCGNVLLHAGFEVDGPTISLLYDAMTGETHTFGARNVLGLPDAHSVLLTDFSDREHRFVGLAYDASGASRPIVVEPECPEDLDDNGAVDFADLLRVLADWMTTCEDSDVDGSRVTDFNDLVRVLTTWGPCGVGGGPDPEPEPKPEPKPEPEPEPKPEPKPDPEPETSGGPSIDTRPHRTEGTGNEIGSIIEK